VLTSGGDQIFPKGLPIGSVTRVSTGGQFLQVTLQPSASLNHLEEVLIITEKHERDPATASGSTAARAADILAQRLPSVPEKPPDDPTKPPPPTSGLKILPAPTAPATSGAAGISDPKPSGSRATRQGPASSVANTSPKPQLDSVGSAVKSGIDSSATKATGKPSAVKPATPQKTAPAAVKIPDSITNTASDRQSQPVPSKPDPQPKQPVTEPTPPQEQPQ
jgi:rod shape-determining protein MreC